MDPAHTEFSQYIYLVAAISDDVKKRIQLNELYGKEELLGEMKWFCV